MTTTNEAGVTAVRCEKNGATSGVFTDGKRYSVLRSMAPISPLVYILDDFGNERAVLPDEPSPHLVVPIPPALRVYLFDTQRIVGRFVTAE